jgi:ABC-2 type transport system ATP-binding protein
VRQLQGDGRTILLVSHAAELVRQIADRAAVLDHGHLVDIAEPGEAIRTLRETLARRGIALLAEDEDVTEPPPAPKYADPPSLTVPAVDVDKPLLITKVVAEYPDPDAKFLLPNQPMRLRIDYFAPQRVDDICMAFEFQDLQGNVIFGDDTQTMEQPIHAGDGVGAVCFDLPRVPLLDGTYLISVTATTRNGGQVYDRRDLQDRFEVMQPGRQRGTVALEPKVVHFFHDKAADRADGTGASADPGVTASS